MSGSDVERIEESGNVVRDLGDPARDLKQAKAVVAARIIAVLDDRRLSVRKAGAPTRWTGPPIQIAAVRPPALPSKGHWRPVPA